MPGSGRKNFANERGRSNWLKSHYINKMYYGITEETTCQKARGGRRDPQQGSPSFKGRKLFIKKRDKVWGGDRKILC